MRTERGRKKGVCRRLRRGSDRVSWGDRGSLPTVPAGRFGAGGPSRRVRFLPVEIRRFPMGSIGRA